MFGRVIAPFGLENELIEPRPARSNGGVVCRERLGGLLKHYERAA